MFCIKCGKQLEEGDVFCGSCGAPVANDNISESQPGNNAPVNPANLQAGYQYVPPVSTAQPQVKVRKSRGKLLPILITVAILIIAGVGIGFGVRARNERLIAEALEEQRRTMREQLRLGNRYLDDLDYERAIAAFEQVIEIDPKNVDAYMGLAEAYIGLGDYEKAIKILKEGEDETDDDDLYDYRKELETVWNVLSGLDGLVVVADSDTNYANNVPVVGADVHIERVGSRFSANTTTDRDGRYHFSDLHLGEYDLTVTADGYATLYQRIEIYELQTDMTAAPIELIPHELLGDGTASGVIYDALEGFGVEGLTLRIRSGAGNLSSNIVASITTDSRGYYQTPSLPAGTYSVEIVDERGYSEKYIDGLINIKILGSLEIGSQNGTVSTELLTGQMRIVLSWGATPSDLDSHLFAHLDNGKNYHTWYSDMEAWSQGDYDGERRAALDLDDTSSYGPETTTIYIQEDGDYTFVVHDFSSYSEMDIAQSGALVQIYMGNSSMPDYVFYAPQTSGYYWVVFKYDSRTGRVTPVNQNMDRWDDSFYDTDPYFFDDQYYYYY